MNAMIESLRVCLEKRSYLSISKGFSDEIRPYTLESGDPHLQIDITVQQARDLCERLLTYFPDVIQETEKEKEEASNA